ncbi:MAG: PEP-CTERM sorting domain-containing protein, partial [Terriglobia bacterium]
LDLMANIPYWLVLTPGTSSTDVIWEGYASSYVPGASGVSAWTKEPALTNLQFRIDGTPVTPVPEPASAGLLLTALGIAGLLYVKRRRQGAGTSQKERSA